MVGFFIERPVFASTAAIIMVLAGFICLHLRPVSQFPEITPPQIIVKASSNQIGKFVYIVGPDNKADQRYVSLGATYGDLVVATKGVEEVDQVIVGNLQRLGPGTVVQTSANHGQGASS